MLFSVTAKLAQDQPISYSNTSQLSIPHKSLLLFKSRTQKRQTRNHSVLLFLVFFASNVTVTKNVFPEEDKMFIPILDFDVSSERIQRICGNRDIKKLPVQMNYMRYCLKTIQMLSASFLSIFSTKQKKCLPFPFEKTLFVGLIKKFQIER